MIDSTIVRAHQHSAGARKKGRGSGHRAAPCGLTTKIHAIIDAAGKAVALSLTPGQRADITETAPAG
ncbi:transposase [Acetobacter sp. AC2005]|uniref:transposase n=1 Tax=Acetobacter sp. AC2005 TaxID=3134142 RepID=UPI0038CFDDA6